MSPNRERNSIVGKCEETVTFQIREECFEGEICFNGECFIPVECTQNADCDFGEVCKEGSCVEETTTNSGIIRSAWPYGIGEYFDSLDLPAEKNEDVSVNYYIIFPGSEETNCLKIKEFVETTFEGGISYIRLDSAPTAIVDGDSYEIWETNYGCSLI